MNQQVISEVGEIATFLILGETDENIVLIWALAEDSKWYLCCRCRDCQLWMQYPGSKHPCTEDEEELDPDTLLCVKEVIPTSLKEVTEKLMCSETFLSEEQ